MMRWHFGLAAVGALALVAGCSGSLEPGPTEPVAVTVPPVVGEAGAGMAEAEPDGSVSDRASSRYGFAWSPVTPLADDVAALVDAALRGEPLPTALPTERIEPDRLVSYGGSTRPASGPLDYLVFGVGVEIAFGTPSASGEASGPGLEAVLVLTATGLHLGMLRQGRFATVEPPPAWLAGVGAAVRGMLVAARDRRLASWVLDERQRSPFGSYWQRVQRELPSDHTIRAIEDFVAEAGPPRGYEVDDLMLLARDSAGRLFSIALGMDEQGGEVVLDARPLVRLRPLPEQEPP